MEEKWKNGIALGSSIAGVVLYIVVFYLVLMCMSNKELVTRVCINMHNEAWWEVLLLPSLGLIVFAGMYLNYKSWKASI